MKQIIILVLVLSVCSLWSLWTSNARVNTPVFTGGGEQTLPKIAVGTDGKIYISCFSNETGNYDVKLQYLTPDGDWEWSPQGVTVSNHPSMTWITDYDMKLGPENSAIVAFSDVRNTDYHPVVYRVAPNGDQLWGADGIALSAEGTFEPNPMIAVTDANNTVVCWQRDTDPTTSIVLQKIAPDGTLLWGTGIVLTSDNGENYGTPVAIPYHEAGSVSDDILLFWFKQTGPFWSPLKKVVAQRIDANGAAVWPTDTVIYNGEGYPVYEFLNVTDDGAGGAYVTWFDDRNNTGMFNTYIQCMDANGVVHAPVGGLAVSSDDTKMYLDPATAYNPATHDFYVFCNMRDGNQSSWGVLGQKFNQNLDLLWTANGLEVFPLSTNNLSGMQAELVLGQPLIVYQNDNFGNVLDSSVQGLRMNIDGTPSWTSPVSLSTYQSSKLKMVIAGFGEGETLAVWEDERTDDGDVYAQNVWADGTLGQIVGTEDPVSATPVLGLVNYPNPVAVTTAFQFNLKARQAYSLEIFNVKGQKVWSTVGEGTTGLNQIHWSVTNASQPTTASGVYFAKLTTGSQSVNHRFIILK